jgi:hypothetical protein
LSHVLIVRPNYAADPAHNAAVNAAYLSQLPLKSEAAVDAFIDAGFAVDVDTGHYFLGRNDFVRPSLFEPAPHRRPSRSRGPVWSS